MDKLRAFSRAPRIALFTMRINLIGTVAGVIIALMQLTLPAMASGSVERRFDPMPLRPVPNMTVSVNPPIFSWPEEKPGPYEVEVASPQGEISRYPARRNWLTLDHTIPPGQYRWRVSQTGKNGLNDSPWADFTVPANAIELAIPSVDDLLARVKQKSRPRSIDLARLRSRVGEINNVLPKLLGKVHSWRGEPLPVEPVLWSGNLAPGAERKAILSSIQQLAFGEQGKILPEALIWLASGDRQALYEAKRRTLNLASWNTQGATGFKAHDEAGLSITWTLALVYDWLYPEFSAAERAGLVVAISDRLIDIMGKGPFGLDDGRRIDVNPYDSHGAVALARVSAICSVMAGTSPQFDTCFRNTVPRYLAWPVPWGRDDGGYANGTNYGQWDVSFTHLSVWDLLRESLGVDLATTPWAQGYGKFITYFLPPGTPTGLFGDGAEKNWRGVWATQAKAYAETVPSALTDWYARQQFGEDETSLPLLLAPYRDWSKTPPQIPADTPNAILMPSIGWIAMHSNLADRGRTSVYFKSSPYGSYSHSHADQNSFVINAKGQPLAIDSGYYDYYDSPHRKNWYAQTRAHNAITFDGGQGQVFDTMAAKGRITQFETTPAFDMATGDATQAYGGALSRAVRSIVYVRPGVLLVFDSLASATPRIWEWNIHALEAIKVAGRRSIEIDNEGERLCVEVLSGPEVDFSQTDQFAVAPSGVHPKQWHGVFRSAARSREFRMLTQLTVGCDPASVEITTSGDGSLVTIGKYSFTFSGEGQVKVQ